MGGNRDKGWGQPVHDKDIMARFDLFLLGFMWLSGETDIVRDKEGFNGHGLEMMKHLH